MGSFFRRANREDVKRYTTDDGQDYIEFRAELTKGEVNTILQYVPSGERDLAGGLAFLEAFFELAVVRWSMVDPETGEPVPPSVEEYRNLEATGARWIDEQISTHMGHIMGTTVDEAEGKPSN